ncbi:MAG TPA: ribonuclease H-like domain-containing protein [Methylomirabilota bacterium]
MSVPLEQRMRELLRARRSAAASPDPARPPAPRPSTVPDRLGAAADQLGGVVGDTPHGPTLVVERFYPADHWHGLVRVGDLQGCGLAASPGLALLGATPEPEPGPPRPLLFVDLETTGIAGGAGTYAFLVGCARFEPHGFRVSQFFLPTYQQERPLLALVDALVRRAAGLVTYNGRTFDVPVLETRFQFNRVPPPFAGLAHVDMLHPARRLWRGAAGAPGAWPQTDSCRLIALERVLFGVRRIGDVPGFEIPGRYFEFMRSGNALPLEPVMEHNRLDLLSLAVMTARALRLLTDAPAASASARESLGSGALLARAGRHDLAERCYRDAAERARYERGPDAVQVRAEALRALALGWRRAGRFAEAADAWQAIAGDRWAPATIRREALEALAIHHEHRSRDLGEARRFAQLSLAERVGTRWMDAGRHRLARLDRKLGRETGPRAPGPLLPSA